MISFCLARIVSVLTYLQTIYGSVLMDFDLLLFLSGSPCDSFFSLKASRVLDPRYHLLAGEDPIISSCQSKETVMKSLSLGTKVAELEGSG